MYQDIVLTPTLTIIPNPNSDFDNFWVLVKRGLYFRYFYIFSTIQKYWIYKPRFMSNRKFSKSLSGLGIMLSVVVRIISLYIWCNFEKFIDCRKRSFTKFLCFLFQLFISLLNPYVFCFSSLFLQQTVGKKCDKPILVLTLKKRFSNFRCNVLRSENVHSNFLRMLA